MEQFRTVSLDGQYGLLPAGFTYEVRRGYTALVGPNNAGKSSLLQAIFRSLVGELGTSQVALILPDREYVQPTTETGGRTLEQWNNDLLPNLASQPLQYGASATGPIRSEQVRVLMDGDFVPQYNAMNDLLTRLDLEPFRLRAGQQVTFREVVVYWQGSGIRGALPILAALTNPDVQAILIDEPELSLEPRLQKVLRDLLIEESERKVIVVATHSHLFVRRDEIEANQRITRDVEKNEVTVKTLTEPRELYDVVFQLLGSSTEDLFFPANYLIVEGASDQVIVAKVLQLLGAESPSIKVLSAQGVDLVRNTVESVHRASVPLIVNDSPYAGRIVALIDEPSDPASPSMVRLRGNLGDRLFLLNAPTIEEYIPEGLYAKAGRSKDDDLEGLQAATGNRAALTALKREISTELAAALTEDDLASLPIIVEAANRAIAETT
jgi:energy-coupling factor transporter ATP-binding protein EcfA2